MCCERKSWELVDWWSDHQMLCWHSIIPLCFRMHRACLLNQTMAQSPFLKSNQSIFLSLLALGEINISNRYKQLIQKAVVIMMLNSENVGPLAQRCHVFLLLFSFFFTEHVRIYLFFCTSLSRIWTSSSQLVIQISWNVVKLHLWRKSFSKLLKFQASGSDCNIKIRARWHIFQ